MLDNYNIKYYGNILKKIGHKNKTERICRWCHKTTTSNPPVTFNEKAHAISEALGNKNLYSSVTSVIIGLSYAFVNG